MAKSVPKSIQTCFRVIFSKKIYAQCSMEGRVFENFQIFFFKIPKIVPKGIQTCFERVLGQTFRKFFAQFSTAFRILEKFQKNQKKISKFRKRPKSFPKESKRVLIVIWDNFFRKIFAQFSMECRVFEKFRKVFFFQNSKNAQKCSQKNPNVF